MSLFKRSNKNKSASAASTPASTPAQTPRASMQTIRDSGIKMTPEEALKYEYLEAGRVLEFVNVKGNKELDGSLMTIGDLAWMGLS
ncbi:MAG: hypothetical protein J3R72DRAFT_525105 [Linnemannia gamsii]|nr:MAG: hypothetical protein J3R72DRAFT_525105 [Linnemannia gamsii]